MNLTKLDSKKECALWEYLKDRLPPSLRATKLYYGYSTVYGIEIKERFSLFGYVTGSPGIATVHHDSIELRHPEWFSDFEGLIASYERQTGKEVDFRYWES